MGRGWRGWVVVVGVVVLGVGVSPAVADVEGVGSGLWWFDRGRVQAAHDAGFDGSGVKVAVIDSQINPDVVGLRGARVTVREPSFCFDGSGDPYSAVSTDYRAASHANHVVPMIVGTGEAPPGGVPVKGVAPGVELLFYNAGVVDGVLDEDGFDEVECWQEDGTEFEDGRFGLDRAISAAVADGADIISISSSSAIDVSKGLAEAYASDVVVVAGMPNDTGIAFSPAVDNGVVAVQAFGADGQIQVGEYGEPNVSDDVVVAAPGLGVLVQGTADSWDAQKLSSGTSLATPVVAGMLAVVQQKYPEATAGQLIQSLIHNTGTKGEHEPTWNSTSGYGAVSLTGMLAVDPTKYPDVNPLFNADDPNEFPPQWMVDEAKAALELAGSTAPPTAAPEAGQPSAGGSAVLPWLVGGGIVVVLLVLAGIVLAIVVTRSSRSQTTDPRSQTTDQGGQP